MNHHFIYGLKDPRTNRYKYVGQSNDPQRRVREHIMEARYDYFIDDPKIVWIKRLLARDLCPRVVILRLLEKTASHRAILTAEKKAIRKLLARGEPLVNPTADGAGNGCLIGREARYRFKGWRHDRERARLNECILYNKTPVDSTARWFWEQMS